MKNNWSTIVLILFYWISTINLYSVPATPFPIKITQPDGSQITIRLKGDEYFHYKTTLDGYPLLTDNAGILNYAQLNSSGKLESTSIKATDIEKRTNNEKSFIRSLKSNPDLTNLNRIGRSLRAKSFVSGSVPQKAYPLTGTPKALVILVNFKDLSFVTPNPQTAFTNLLNQPGYSTNGGTGSAKDYFHDSSSGAFNPQFDVIGPVTLDNPMAFYGINNASGDDTNPQQMVIDACTKASAGGLVDFSQYDTDNNGIVDNVFIYYAGYNEAEGGPANSIWPHKWSLNNNNTKFNGVSVYNYACTSELRGSTGANMCGIGTFCHEFGHVLGLADYYVTSGKDHHTLSLWNIMDSGPYLNSGRTPPTYCAYDRYFLKWLTPTQLDTAGNYNLDTLSTSNMAFMISQTANRNLDVANNTNSPEYFLLENRQKKGWDAYLPNSGMLVYHIYYNSTTWENNGPNNDPNAMGVDIVEADGISLTESTSYDPTLSGDPFPGTSKVTVFKPLLRDGTKLTKNVSNIKEKNGLIGFLYGTTIGIPIAYNSNDIKVTSIVATWSEVPKASGYYLSVYHLENENEIFDLQEKFIITTSDTINYLLPGKQYFYKVVAIERINDYENITDFSNTISVKTLDYPFKNKLLTTVQPNGDLTVYLPTLQTTLYIYNLKGQIIRTIIPKGSMICITDLPRNQFYILKADKLITKIAI